MRVLLDECVPKGIKRAFSEAGHKCSTAPEAGFAGKTNGELLRLAEKSFDVLITLDKGFGRQGVRGARLAIVRIRAKSSRVVDILAHVPACLDVLDSLKPGEIVQVGETG